ncbi:hypothetical protein OG458_42190 (plasmid) [Streptomyces sp. NBC_01281]|uniref:hypothetical protein n=1 Tax=Streptomyces sp. NBC_01281 TaxID=2903811 RepID=UPI002E0DA279|nr:hypothetical protein OG458_42190 [Streptomyces sp. NBC_01281]
MTPHDEHHWLPPAGTRTVPEPSQPAALDSGCRGRSPAGLSPNPDPKQDFYALVHLHRQGVLTVANQRERDAYGDSLHNEFDAYASALTARGKDWASTWSSAWPPEPPLDDPSLAALQARFALAREWAAVAGIRPSDHDITDEHRARQAYRDLFPDGAPTLTP